ncbi:hypothetical protein ACFLTP_09035 [Chloroflexota bacterium]
MVLFPDNGPEGRKRSPYLDSWAIRVDHAVRHISDRIELNRNPLARITYVQKMAKERYQGHVHPSGLALRELLIECIERITSDLGDEPAQARVCRYLAGRKEGLNSRQISSELGLSREHVSRTYRPKALGLLADELRSITRTHRRH